MTDSRATGRLPLALLIAAAALFWITYRDTLDPISGGTTVRVATIQASQSRTESSESAEEDPEPDDTAAARAQPPSRERLAFRRRQVDRFRKTETLLRDQRRALESQGGSTDAIAVIDRHLARLGDRLARLESELATSGDRPGDP